MSEVKSKIKRVSALKQRGKVLRETDPLLAVFQWGCNHMVYSGAMRVCNIILSFGGEIVTIPF